GCAAPPPPARRPPIQWTTSSPFAARGKTGRPGRPCLDPSTLSERKHHANEGDPRNLFMIHGFAPPTSVVSSGKPDGHYRALLTRSRFGLRRRRLSGLGAGAHRDTPHV